MLDVKLCKRTEEGIRSVEEKNCRVRKGYSCHLAINTTVIVKRAKEMNTEVQGAILKIEGIYNIWYLSRMGSFIVVEHRVNTVLPVKAANDSKLAYTFKESFFVGQGRGSSANCLRDKDLILGQRNKQYCKCK